MNNRLPIAILFFWYFLNSNAIAEKNINIYLDADRTVHVESALSIEMGLRAALSQIDYQLQGYKINLVIQDHRGNSNRSKLHMDKFLADPDALFIMSGIHSPPLIKYQKFINENEILILVPWAAGGPVTRYTKGLNWVFRLSVDDTKAGFKMAEYANKNKQCRSPHLLLENTPWGESNNKNMLKAFKDFSNLTPAVTWFGWNTNLMRAQEIIRSISSNSDCVMFVGNVIEGEMFITEFAKINNTPKIISHWGITGGQFNKKVPYEIREKSSLKFIQSCFDIINSKSSEKNKAIQAIKQKHPDLLTKPENIPAPTGFIHAYDLGKIFIAAASQIQLSDNMKENRKNLRNALENIKQPIQGLIKKYQKPFSSDTKTNPDAHEALGADDLCMGYYDINDEVVIIPNE